jgi:uncharacterized protein
MADQANTEMVREGYEAWNRRDFDGVVARYADDITLESDARFLDFPTFKGRAEVRRFIEQLHNAWGEINLETLHFEEAGDKVVVEVRVTGKGKESGIEFEEVVAHVWTVRDGKLTHAEYFPSLADARETVEAGA